MGNTEGTLAEETDIAYPSLLDGGGATVESIDKRTVSLLRLLLASAALLISVVDPSIPERFLVAAYLALFGYCIYAAFLYLLVRRETLLIPIRFTHWIDVGWYALLVGLSNGSSSIFFFFFFFPVLIASFRWGYREGIWVTGVCEIVFIVVGYVASPSGEAFELNRFLIRPMYLFVFGYLIASWGGREVVFRRRLNLLKEVNTLSNPRFGIDRTLQSIVSKVRAFYNADSCLLIPAGDDSNTSFFASFRRPPVDRTATIRDLAARLETLGTSSAIFYESAPGKLFEKPFCSALDLISGVSIDGPVELGSGVAGILNSSSLIILPLHQHDEFVGRLCLAAGGNVFDRSDIDFLRQLADQVLPNIENVQLLDKLASQAAETQREKTSRDIHDSTIQPYIGLKLGLEALDLKADSGEPINADIRKLIALAETTINELRGFVKELKGDESDAAGNVLLTAIRQQGKKYAEFHGIDVNVEAADGFQLNDRLAAEVFQIISEGLSNIKRHTNAKNATIRLSRTNERFRLDIENPHDDPLNNDSFVPKSIYGRARSLGGTARALTSGDRTTVTVQIPL